MARIAKPIVIFFMIVAILGLPATTMASEEVISIAVPVHEEFYFGHCDSEGQEGEWVVFDGTTHLVVREDVFTVGGIHQNYHTNWKGVRGVGMTTGNLYVITGVFNLTTNRSPAEASAHEHTYATNLRIISQGSRDNYTLHTNFRLTLGPDGEVHAELEFIREECRG